jgi:hypothetical protein
MEKGIRECGLDFLIRVRRHLRSFPAIYSWAVLLTGQVQADRDDIPEPDNHRQEKVLKRGFSPFE